MKVSTIWLQDLVDIQALGIDTAGLADTLSGIGLAVEEVQQVGDDWILEVDVTSNRPDCLCHLGIAREIAAHFAVPLKVPDSPPPEALESEEDFPARVDILDPQRCPRYSARIVTGVKIGPSPQWLKQRLESLDQRPVNNVVDVTNFVMLETGQPLHAFDYEKLAGRRIIVRTAREGEKIETLDSVVRELSPSMLAICDAHAPVAVAGVMGGAESEISDTTVTLLLESAYFDAASIRSTSRALGLRTEASYRFERGADPKGPVCALNRACILLAEIAGGRCCGPVIDCFPTPPVTRTLPLRSCRIEQVVGRHFDPEFVEGLLPRLDFRIQRREEESWDVEIPSFRVDMTVEDDLVEELARHYGYDRIESSYPPAVRPGAFLPTEVHERRICGFLTGKGFCEAVNYAFSTPATEGTFWGQTPAMVPLANPITEEDSHLRTTLMPGLLASLQRNFYHGQEDVRLFELGHVFVPSSSGELEDVYEAPRLGLVATGGFYHPFWQERQESFSFLHMKGLVEHLFRELEHTPEFHREESKSFLHPGLAARVEWQGQVLGWMGRLHPRLREHFKFPQDVLLAEFALETVYGWKPTEPHYRPLNRFPSMQRDLSFVVDKNIEFGKIVEAITFLNVPDLQDTRLIDLYQGPSLPNDKVSLTVRLTFENAERTLTQEEVAQFSAEVFSKLKATFGVQPRS